MYCDKCGANVVAEQRFCRVCGSDQQTALSAGQDFSGALADAISRFNSRREKTKRLGFLTIWVGILEAAALGVASGVLASAGSSGSEIAGSAAGFGGVFVLAGFGIMWYSRFLPQVSIGKEKPQSKNLPPAKPMLGLPASAVDQTSITESTTRHLETTARE